MTGISGQGGSCLAALLLEKGYEVHGLIRRSGQFNTQRIDHLLWNAPKPDGQPRKSQDTTRAREAFGFASSTAFAGGLSETMGWHESGAAPLQRD